MTMWSAECAVSTLLSKNYCVCKCGAAMCGSQLPPGGLDGLLGEPRVTRIKCGGLLVMHKVLYKLFPRYLKAPMKSLLHYMFRGSKICRMMCPHNVAHVVRGQQVLLTNTSALFTCGQGTCQCGREFTFKVLIVATVHLECVHFWTGTKMLGLHLALV